MNAVEKLIFNSLATHNPVYLPGLGQLSVEKNKAAVVGDSTIAPASVKVIFSEKRDSDVCSLIDLIRDKGIDTEAAGDAYRLWLENASTGHHVSIEGVGIIKNGKFSIYPELDAILNPAPVRSLPSPKKSRCQAKWFALIVPLCLVLGALAGYFFSTLLEPDHAENDSDVKTVNEEICDCPDSSSEEFAESPAEPVTAEPVTAYHVIGGVFSIPENADKYIRDFKRWHPEHGFFEKVPYKNGMTMVSLFKSDNFNEAYRKRYVYDWNYEEPDLWIYEAK